MKAFVLMCALIGAAATAQAKDLFICHYSDIHVLVSRNGNTLHDTGRIMVSRDGETVSRFDCYDL